MPPMVSIVIVNYGKDWLSKCLSSLAITEYPSSRFETIVVDNASSDDLGSIENTFSKVRLIRLEKNIGYARAVNLGVENSAGEYIAVLNNDVIVTPDWLGKLVDVLKGDEGVGAVCPRKRSLLMDQRLDGCGGAFNVLGQGWDRGEGEVDVGQFADSDEVTHPPGAIFLTRKALVDQFDFLFNPDFFMLVEDVDFGLRCWKAGYKVVYTPNCVVQHARSPTLGGLNEYNLYFYTKNLLAMTFEIFDSSVFIRLLPLLIATQMTQALYLLYSHRKSHAVPSVLRAIRDFLVALPSYRRRKVKIDRVTDRDILDKFSRSLVTFEESRRYERSIRLFLSAVNVYVKIILQTKPVDDILYFKKTPR